MIKPPRKATGMLPILATAMMLFFAPLAAEAAVEAASVFGSHMVLQQGMEVPVWGTADEGQEITVSFDGQIVKTKANGDGKWMLHLTALKATANQAGQKMTITAGNGGQVITFDDVLIGEVWLCSGQSNMWWKLRQSSNAKEEISNANLPQMRLLEVGMVITAREPLDELSGQWQVCSPQTASGFSGVAYFFGKKLNQDLNVPVGLINSSVGATLIPTWISGKAIKNHIPSLQKAYEEWAVPGTRIDKLLEEYHASGANREAASNKIKAAEADTSAADKVAAATYADSSWKSMDLPNYWTKAGLPKYEGMVWFRKTIDIPAGWAGKDLVLEPGEIYSIDVTWFNGSKVGQTGSYASDDLGRPRVNIPATPREYRVPGNLVKAGRNVIAIRVINAERDGGILDTKKQGMKVSLASDKSQSVSLAGSWKYEATLEIPAKLASPEGANRPSILFNGMIHPLAPYGIRGAVWYQGESNAKHNTPYVELLTGLMNDWRDHWGQSDLPFLIVQLPNFGERGVPIEDAKWAKFRQLQKEAVDADKNAYMAVTIDVGDAKQIHPTNKLDVGNRLALIAEAKLYGKDVIYSGPVYKSHTIRGSEVTITFDHVEGGLVQKGSSLEGFAVAGADGKFVPAAAKIQGSNVVVSAPGVSSPKIVSYAWDEDPLATLYNKSDLPAAPFKTDEK